VRGVGSGVIVSSDGYVLTNNHVVEGATRVTVVLDDDRELEAQVIGTDPETDLAVVKVDATNLPAAQLGDSSSARVGQWVIAVGNPFELRHTVTAGIISATGRSTVGLATYEDFIQTDASINPGNSGGALADLDGRVIGINTAISSPSGGNVGIGFAIPIDMAERVMADLIDDGSISRGFLALIPQDLDPALAKAFGLESTDGALVADVTQEGPADRAGIESGDVIVAFDGEKVRDSNDLRNRVAAVEPGAEIAVDLLRDGKKKTVKVELGTRPGAQTASMDRSERGERDQLQSYGLRALDLTPELAEQTGYTGLTGVLIAEVDPAGTAARAGLRRGDLIQRVGRSEVTSVAELGKILAANAKAQGDIALLVRRGQGSVYLALPAIEAGG
jgi:serine protease Do